MADRADQWFFTAVGRPCDHFSIEHPQIFPAAAAAGHDDLVHLFALVQLPDRICDLLCGLKALHRYRTQKQLYRGPAPGEYIADILQCSSRFAGDNTNAFRECRQRLFMFRGKQALLLQLCFELLQCKLCGTNAIRKHIVHIQLKGTVTLIKGRTAACHNAHPLFRAEGKTACICTEHYSLHTAGFIPQGKIAVAAACVLYKVCDLAAQGNVKQSVVCIQQHFNVVVQG